MAKTRFPAVGDIVVLSPGPTGTYKVLSVSETDGTTKLQPFNVSKQEAFGKVMEKIPRKAIHSFEEDASQSAARIVREATEK